MKKTLIVLALAGIGAVLSACGASDWEKAQEADTIEALDAYVRANPNGEHVAAAELRIEALAWAEAEGADSRDGYLAYLDRLPGGGQAEEARERLAEIDWQAASAAGTVEGYADYIRSAPGEARVIAARNAVVELQPDATADRPAVELSGMFSGGIVRHVEYVAARYEGEIAGMPASVAYAVVAGSNGDGEQQFFTFQDGDNVLSIRANLTVQGSVTLQTPGGEAVEYELFGLVKADDDDLVGSYLVGRGPDLLWSSVAGLTTEPAEFGADGAVLSDGDGVLFAVHDNFRLLYVP